MLLAQSVLVTAAPAFQATRRRASGETTTLGLLKSIQKKIWLRCLLILKQACSSEYQRAQYAFKDSMIHWILQFTLRIAFRCVLHRCESQEIRCWKLCLRISHSLTASDNRSYRKVYVEKKKRLVLGIALHDLRFFLLTLHTRWVWIFWKSAINTLIVNDPSAGSPTETLLRLLLPLNDQVWITFQIQAAVASCLVPIRKPH